MVDPVLAAPSRPFQTLAMLVVIALVGAAWMINPLATWAALALNRLGSLARRCGLWSSSAWMR